MKIRDITYAVRSWAEKYAQKNHFPDDLCGMCGIASVKLWKELNKANFKITIVCNDEHVFLESKKYIIDITATQYGIKEHLIVKKNIRRKSFWAADFIFADPDDFIQHQKKVGWPNDQIYDAE